MPKKIFLHGRYVEKYFYQIMFSRHVPTLKKLGHSLLPSSFRIMLAWYFHITLVHHSGNGCKKIKNITDKLHLSPTDAMMLQRVLCLTELYKMYDRRCLNFCN